MLSGRNAGILFAGFVVCLGTLGAVLAGWTPFKSTSGPNQHPGQGGPGAQAQGCPQEAPPYPNAREMRVRGVNLGADSTANPVFDAGMLVYTQKVTSFKTIDKPEAVRAFYVGELLKAGWRVNNGTPSPNVHQFYWQPPEGASRCGGSGDSADIGPSTYIYQLDMKQVGGETEVTLRLGYEKAF